MNISNIVMNKKKYIFFIFLALICVVCVYGVNKYFLSKRPAARVSLSSILQKTKEIDKLYTGVYIIPALDKKYGMLKRDKLNPVNMFKETSDKQVVKGYCVKKYEVSVGYENISELLSNKELIANACRGNIDQLPNPTILAVNCRKTETRGDYTGNDLCYQWDHDEQMRKTLLTKQMQENNILDKVNKRGREALKTIATIFCE